MAELKPCPFCGGEAETWQHLNGGWMIRCKKCASNASSTGLYRLLNVAVEKWNKRTEPDNTELKADNERLREMWAKAVSDLSKCKAERPKGRWEFVEQRFYHGGFVNLFRCSECKVATDKETNFCPNCGADMRGDSE